MAIILGDIRFDEQRLYKQLRNDLRDDWFPDPIQFADMIDGGIVSDRISDNFERNHGRYEACERTLFNIPKPNFTIRYALEIGLEDRALYHGICSYLFQHYDNLIPWYVFSHRQDHQRSTDRYMFRHGVSAWRDFTEAVRSEVNDANFLLSTDLTNYFENINLNKLHDELQSIIPQIAVPAETKSCIRSHIRVLFECLARWSFDGQRGLAQNRDASSFLANAYMLSVDKAMRDAGYRYFRYMDDIKIVCSNELEARRALQQLIVELRDIGLAVNAKKTVITAGGARDVVERCLDIANPSIERLSAMWQTRRREIIGRSFPELRTLTETLLTSEEVDSRDFRYCMARMIVLASCREFAVPDAFFSAITHLVISRLQDSPAATDQFLKYLRVVHLTPQNLSDIAAYVCDPERNFYGWQCYLLWILLASRGYRERRLYRHALRSLDGEDGANRTGATLYIGAIGAPAGRRRVARKFESLGSFLGQRVALVAIHELPFRGAVKEGVAPHVRRDLVGVYRGLQSRRGTYIAPPPAVSITTYVDTERDYA
jgi:hypothetical protein